MIVGAGRGAPTAPVPARRYDDPTTTRKTTLTALFDDETLRHHDERRVHLLTRPRQGRNRMVIDTDAYNEIDDQFALVHTLLSPDRVDLEAIYAAPFHNDRSESAEDGMRKSFAEIQRILAIGPTDGTPVLEGAISWLTTTGTPSATAASNDLIERALAPNDLPLYVVAIGAPTNVATALLLEPEIANRIVVIWLGGHALFWPTAAEFNLQQDLLASRLLFDSGVALVHVPCSGVADRLTTTHAEVERYVRAPDGLGHLLAELYSTFIPDVPGHSKVIWDLAATAWLLEPAWTTTRLVPSPVLTSDMTWSSDPGRHLIGEVTAVDRDGVFADLFRRLAAARVPPVNRDR